MDDSLAHHGIKGQQWGIRRGPPYPLEGGEATPPKKKRIHKYRIIGNNTYTKRHFDTVLKKNSTTLQTLSYNKDRTKDTDMFYATHTFFDKHQYNALFNGPKEVFTAKLRKQGNFLKFSISNKLKSDMKVASEDSSAAVFIDLYKHDRDFYNFVRDDDRMANCFAKDRYKFKGYRESNAAREKLKDPSYKPTELDLKIIYRMFNYSLPYDGGGNDDAGAADMKRQRDKFFRKLKNKGYGALLDVNDALYGGFKARDPIIVFDMEDIIPSSIKQTTMSSKYVSEIALAVRKAMGL